MYKLLNMKDLDAYWLYKARIHNGAKARRMLGETRYTEPPGLLTGQSTDTSGATTKTSLMQTSVSRRVRSPSVRP